MIGSRLGLSLGKFIFSVLVGVPSGLHVFRDFRIMFLSRVLPGLLSGFNRGLHRKIAFISSV